MNARQFARHYGRKWTFLAVAALGVFAIDSHAAGADRYVSAVAGSDATDCSSTATPCLTIAYAISQANAYDTIHVAAGMYASATAPVVTLEGLQIIGDALNKPVLTRLGGATNQQLLVINGAKNVRVANFDFHIDQTFVAEGILASGFVDGLTIVNNHFGASQSSTAASTFGFRNAISINDVRNSAGLPRVDGSAVLIDGNVIDGVSATQMRSGIDMDAGLGTISNNTVTAGTHDIIARFSTVVTGSSATSLTIDHNTLNGRGLEFDAPNGGVSAVTISNNTINAIAGIDGGTNYAADWSLLRLIGNQQNIPTTLSGNTFQGHNGAYRGVLIENYPGVQLTGNVFTPASGATDFVSLVVSNKEINSVSPPSAPYPMALTALGNTFNGSGVANAGRAVEFLNDNNAGATFGSLIFGGAGSGDANSFDGNLRWYFHLDDYNCDTFSTPCTFLNYTGATTVTAGNNTQVRPFTGNVSAAQNVFAGAAPSAATLNALQARTYDKNANPALGSVDYGLSGTTPIVYVGASFAGSGYGDAKSFVSSASACGSQTVYFGINAFATIPDGIMHVQSGGTVCVAKGAYAASVMIAKPLQLIGDGNGAADTVIGAQLNVNAGGSAVATPLLIQNLRVANPTAGGHGIVVSSFLAGAPIAHLHFDAVSSTSNVGYGLAFDIGAPGSANAPGIDDVAISNSHFDNNGNFGLMAGRYAVVSNVAISNSTFQGNEMGGAGFFETGGAGTGQISHWNVTDSQFLSNAPNDTSSGGGGLWIKTGGAGSSINDVSVTGSTFADNGSGGTYNGRFMNRVGIHVRARAGTTLAGINICNNTFSETATPGTQETGIYVFDQTGNTGYQPITVCASNDFSSLPDSVSGYEQWKTSGSQPVVNITGGTIANTEYINGFVTRVRDSATFPSITAAMNDAATTTGDEIHAPAGVYHEKVTITHDGIKLSGDGASTIINGTGLTGNGIDASTRQNVTITSLAVQNFDIASSEGACIYTSGGSNGLTVTNTVISECRNGRGGIYVNAIGDVDNVTLSNNDISNSDDRGIVVWNGAKSHFIINGNTIHGITGSAGIALQDGTASDVTISGNTLTDTGDSGIFALGLSSGTITNNQVNIAGRYGIQLLNPAGADATSITVQGNTVNLTALPALINDIAGISVVRRYASAGGADNPNGVTISGNTVHGWQSSASRPGYDGFGIAIEGTAISVSGNTLSNNDIGVQLQAGNAGYPGDSDQSQVNDFFSRGDAQTTCADLGTNTFTTNGLDSRSVTNPPGQSLNVIAHNTTRGTSFCTIQGAINAATTLAGDTITVDAGTFGENVVVSKSLVLKGPKATFAGYDSARDGSGEAVISPATGKPLYVTAANAIVDGFTFDGARRGQAVVTNTAAATNLQFINNRITDVFGAAGILAAQDTQDWTIARNLFKDFVTDFASPVQYAQAIKYNFANGALIEDNVFIHVQSNALQVERNTGTIQVLNNRVDGQAPYYTNTGLQLDGNSGATVLARDNTFTNTQIGLLLGNGSSSTTTVCNTVTNSQTGLRTQSIPSFGSADAGRVFDNAMANNGRDVNNGWSAGQLVVGSNFYNGAAPTRGGSASLIADPLPATPIGSASCGDNTPTQIVAKSGSGQSTLINTTFGQPLVARVVDVLGGAVMGQSIEFSSPASGASASLASSSGTGNYNGAFSTAASANALAGSYNVTATSGTLGSASFALTNTKGAGTVVFDNLNLTYTGSAQTLTAHMTPTDTNVTCVLTPATVTNAGSYAVTANCSGDNYAASGSATVTVAKAVGTITFDGGLVYTGAAQNVTAHITEEPGTSCTATPATVGPDAGSYAVNVASCDGINYTASGNGVVVIAKAQSTVTINQADLHQSYGSTHAVGASASPITTGSVSVTYDGSASVPTATGSYSVVATLNDPNYTGSASAILVIGDASAVTVTINGPAQALLSTTNAPYTDLVDYSGTIRNSGPQTSQDVHYEISVVRIDDGNATGGQPIAIAADDVLACIYDPSGWAAQDPGNHHGCPQDYESLFLGQTSGAFNGRPATVFRYPNLAGNDTSLPMIDPAMPLPPSKFQFKHGDYQVHLSVVGTDGRIYATAMSETTVPDAAVSYNGATSGQAEDALLSQATLTNVGGRVDENVIVRITLSDTANATLTQADATLYYQYGSGFVALPWTQAGNNLVTYYGPSNGFPLEDGHNATMSGQGIFHREGSYGLLYEVVDVATGQVIYASTQQTIVIGQNLANFNLTDLHQVYNGTPRPVSVDPSNVPHVVIYEALTGASCPATPNGNNTTAPTNAGSYCVYVTATAPYGGTAQGVLVIAKARAMVSIDGAVSGIVNRNFNNAPQVVTATATPTVAAIDVTYTGSASAPSAAGSYSLLATVNDPNYYGNATGTLVIAAQGGATITLNDVDASDSKIHRTYSGSAVAPVTATTTPTGLSYAVTYIGDGSTVYPLTATPPTAVGQYHVVATTTDANYATISASGTLVVEPGSASITLDTTTLTAVYDGNAHVVTATTTPAGLAYTVTYNGLLDAPSAAGSYAVVATITDPNQAAAPATGTLVISSATAGIVLDAATLNATYDGQLHAVTATTTPPGLAYSVTYNGNANPPVDAGSYAVVATITAPGHSGSVSGTLVIAKATGTVNFGATNFTFDGTAYDTTAVISQEPANNTACTLTASAGEYPRTNAGSTTLTAACSGTNFTATGSTTLIVSPKPVTITLTGLGMFAYDGSPHAATAVVTGDIAGFSAATVVTYNGGSAAPITLGSYAVNAALDAASTNYSAAPANGTITIVSGAAGAISANGSIAFSGTAGQLLVGAQPSVKVTDAGANPVSGVTVTFAATAGNGTLVAATQTTDANGIATLGGWILGATPGTNTLTATAAGVTGSVTFTAEGAAAAGALQVTITDYRDYVQFAHPLTYVMTIGNNGTSNMTGVAVSDVLPVELTLGVNAWQCIAINGATCNAVTTRDLSGTVDLPAHSSVTYLLNALVNDTGTDLLSNTITATGPAGPVSATDTTEIVIFRNGFEEGGDGAQAVAPVLDGASASTLTTAQPVSLDIAGSALASLRITPVAQAKDGAFRIEAIRVGKDVWLRLVARNGAVDNFSAWSTLSASEATLTLSNDGKQLNLAGTASDLDISLAKAGPFAIEQEAR